MARSRAPLCQVNFFQGSAVAAWLGFAITFVSRPFGGVVLGASARAERLGRAGDTWGDLFLIMTIWK